MKLRLPWGNVEQSGAVTGNRRTDGTGRTEQPRFAGSSASLNRQIRSMVPGQTIRGEIISRNGSEVQIKLSDDMVLQARIDQNMNLEMGKTMTFEIRNNGSALTLSPLFENMSADVNVLKALDMANLPVNETTVSLTRQLMQAGLSVDRNSLQQVYREVTSFPQAEVSDVVALHKLGMSVNETNVNQMISYRNLTHQLLSGMETVLEALPEAMEEMARQGELQGLTGLYRQIFALIREGAEEGVPLPGEPLPLSQAEPEFPGGLSEGNGAAPKTGEMPGSPESPFAALADAAVGRTPAAAAGILLENFGTGKSAGMPGTGEAAQAFPADGALAEGKEAASEAVPRGLGLPEEGNALPGGPVLAGFPGDVSGTAGPAGNPAEIPASVRQDLSRQLLDVLSGLPMEPEEARGLAQRLEQFARGNLGPEELFAAADRMMRAARTVENGVWDLHRVFSGDNFKNLLQESLKSLWTVRPEELAEQGRVEDLYRRMDRQLRSLGQALESGGQVESTAFRATSNMTQNLDFLNQLNQLYTYVQLPLRLSQGEAHGDLYVYTNRRNLVAKDGKISALLHLDMEHLGPVDVYVAMEQSRVSTKFFVRDDEMLDFLEAHMHILTERLQKRGYDCSVSMTSRNEDEKSAGQGGIGPLLEQEGGVQVAQYAFDMRA